MFLSEERSSVKGFSIVACVLCKDVRSVLKTVQKLIKHIYLGLKIKHGLFACPRKKGRHRTELMRSALRAFSEKALDEIPVYGKEFYWQQ